MDEGNGQPGGFDAAYLITKYKSEFDVLVIPSFVKKVIFPVIIFFGKLSGKHKKFVDAPKAAWGSIPELNWEITIILLP